MHFSLHSLGPEYESNLVYFRLHAAEAEVVSPIYPDPTTALENIKTFLLTLRKENSGGYVEKDENGSYFLYFFGKKKPAVGEFPTFSGQSTPLSIIDHCREAARATTFKVDFMGLKDELEDVTTLKDLDLTKTDSHYNWQEIGATLIHLPEDRFLGFIPRGGMQANLNRKPCEPIFNAFQPSLSTDIPLFMGRKKEVKEVFSKVQNENLLLLYGEAKVGKTSLLQCGLVNRAEENREKVILVHRQDHPVLEDLREKLWAELKDSGQEVSQESSLTTLAGMLEEQSEGKIYLVFDQLEHLFLAEVTEKERSVFFEFIREVTEAEETRFRVILSLREASLASMADYEVALPSLLDNRYRLLPAKQESLQKASVNLFELLQGRNLLAVDNAEEVSASICSNLANDKGEVPVQCLQIYMHQLQQKSCQNTEPGSPVPFTNELVEESGPPALLIDEFISNRITELKEEQGQTEDPVKKGILAREIDELENSRVQCGCGDKKQAVAAAAVVVPPIIGVPWWLFIPLMAIPLFLFGYWWLNASPDAPTACELAKEEDDCFAYVDYLCTYGDSTECSADFLATITEKNCAILADYEKLQATDDCLVYQEFYEKYNDAGICMDRVTARLLEWGCPIVRDTLKLTIRDTIIQRIPTVGGVPTLAGNTPQLPYGPDGPPCKQYGTTNFKRVGPLWVMTDAVAGGPYTWEDGLDACSDRGFRLPCIGEIDWLLEKIYSGDSDRAYEMLTGTSSCYLVNPAEAVGGKIEFWTATEANDAAAWTYSFDVEAKTIKRQSATPKSARLPCLCVQKEPEKVSGIPICYQKNIRRPK